jgi:hypothetical protein
VTTLRPEDWWLRRAFVYVGRIDPDKGVLAIVAAWRELRARVGEGCPPLWLVGGTPEEIDVLRASIPDPEELARDERAGRIHWWGYLDPPGISTVLLRALALVVHSRYEPGGRVVLEAMTEGVPVIATPHGFAATLVQDWCTGFLVDFGDTESLARRMEHFVRQPLLRSALGDAARAAAAAALKTWSFIDVHCEVYRAALAQRAPPRDEAEISPPPCLFPRFAPIYPHGHRPPSGEDVLRFVERALRHPASVHSGPPSGRSVAWSAEAGGREWIVTWPAPVLRRRPIWDPDDEGPHALGHRERWASSAFACGLPFHLPLSGADEDLGLLLFRALPPAPLDWRDLESAREVAAVLRRARGSSDPEASELAGVFDRSWRAWSDPELREAAARKREVLDASGHPWFRWSHVSLRHAWARRTRDIASGRLAIPAEWARAVGHAGGMVAELAEAESVLLIRACHGALRLDRIRAEGSRLWLLGGERAHLAYPGADMARLLAEASAGAGHSQEERAVYWDAALPLVAESEQERAVIVGWAALAAVEGMARNYVMGRAERFAAHAHDWSVALRVASRLAGSVSQ